MDEEAKIREFMKPKCPVKVGDKFYKNFNVPSLIFWEVQNIEEKEDDQGSFFAITAKANNIAIGNNVKVFSSRVLDNGTYTIVKRGTDIG